MLTRRPACSLLKAHSQTCVLSYTDAWLSKAVPDRTVVLSTVEQKDAFLTGDSDRGKVVLFTEKPGVPKRLMKLSVRHSSLDIAVVSRKAAPKVFAAFPGAAAKAAPNLPIFLNVQTDDFVKKSSEDLDEWLNEVRVTLPPHSLQMKPTGAAPPGSTPIASQRLIIWHVCIFCIKKNEDKYTGSH